MSLRVKLALVLASLAALAAVGVGWFSYDATSTRMLSEIDATLKSTARLDQAVGAGPPVRPGPNSGIGNDSANNDADGDSRPPGLERNVYQGLDVDGQRIFGTEAVTLPISDEAVEIARSGSGQQIETVTGSDGNEYRVLTRTVNRFGTVQIGRDLSEMNRVLDNLRTRLLLVGLIAVAIAAIAGWALAGGLTKSLRKLTAAAAEVSTTGRLDINVSSGGNDEVGRLGTAFATMLAALKRSREDQQRLIQDAGHELRTPLTSLRTNVDVLRRHPDLPAETRDKVLADLDIEVAELSSLVEEVVTVGSGRTSDEPARRIALAEVLTAASDRVGRRTGRTFVVDADESSVVAQRGLLERAITNLLDNAAKFDHSDQQISITSRGGRVAVRDHGPGIDPADLPYVFDRFFRAVGARSLPGSGLGLSIVAEVAVAHGGSAFAENHPDGGAVVGMQLPVAGP